MFIYQLENEFLNESEDDIIFEYEYFMHEKQFTDEEFNNMCNEGLKCILDINNYELKRFLILNYGFKDLPISCSFTLAQN
jgi:hypothetical protein